MIDTNKFYPIVIIPKSFIKAFTPPSEPKQGNPPLLSFIKERTVICLIALLLISSGIWLGSAVPFVIGLIVLVYQYFAIDSYKHQKKTYEKLLQDYNKYWASRFMLTKTYSYVKKGEKHTFNRNCFFVNKLDEFLKFTAEPKITQNHCKRGVSELFFKKHLMNYLNLDFKDLQYEVTLSGKTYYPDVVIKVKVGDNTAYIDVEIDEPYSLDSRPIHYIGSDNSRNSCFEKNNWIVVRFAEEQIFSFPDECSEVVRSIVMYLYSGGTEEIFDYESIKVPHWTSSQAQQMMRENYRYTYWPRAEKLSSFDLRDLDSLNDKSL